MRLIATVLAVGLLSACTQGYYVKHRSPISVSKHVKRLNTTACHDKDGLVLRWLSSRERFPSAKPISIE